MTATRPPKVTAALEAAAAAKAARTPAETAVLDAILVRTAHLFICTPMEIVGVDKHKWHRELAAPLGECDCGGRPLRVLGPEHFLAGGR